MPAQKNTENNSSKDESKRPFESSQSPFQHTTYIVSHDRDVVDIFDLFAGLKKRLTGISLFTIFGVGLALIYAFVADPIYLAKAVIAPPETNKAGLASSAGLVALGGLGAEVASSLGILPGPADASRLKSLLESHRLIDRVVSKHSLLPIIFADRWDTENKSWLIEDDAQPPDIWDAEPILRNIFKIEQDNSAGVLRLSLEFKYPQLAKQILSNFISELALLIQEDELKKININMIFIEKKLQETRDPVVAAKLQALLSEQIEKSMMAQNVDQLAYEMIDPPSVSDQWIKPKRKFIVFLAFFASLFLSLFIAIILEWLDVVKNTRGI